MEKRKLFQFPNELNVPELDVNNTNNRIIQVAVGKSAENQRASMISIHQQESDAGHDQAYTVLQKETSAGDHHHSLSMIDNLPPPPPPPRLFGANYELLHSSIDLQFPSNQFNQRIPQLSNFSNFISSEPFSSSVLQEPADQRWTQTLPHHYNGEQPDSVRTYSHSVLNSPYPANKSMANNNKYKAQMT